MESVDSARFFSMGLISDVRFGRQHQSHGKLQERFAGASMRAFCRKKGGFLGAFAVRSLLVASVVFAFIWLSVHIVFLNSAGGDIVGDFGSQSRTATKKSRNELRLGFFRLAVFKFRVQSLD